MIVVGIRKPGATTRESRETTVELRPESVEVIASKLVDGYENHERGRAACAAICFGRGLGAGPRAAQYAKEEEKRFDRSPHSQIIPQ